MSAVYGESKNQFTGICASTRDPDNATGISAKNNNAEEVSKIQEYYWEKVEKLQKGLVHMYISHEKFSNYTVGINCGIIENEQMKSNAFSSRRGNEE